MEKGRDNPLHLASGLPYITKDLALLAAGLRCRLRASPTGYHLDPAVHLAVPYQPPPVTPQWCATSAYDGPGLENVRPGARNVRTGALCAN